MPADIAPLLRSRPLADILAAVVFERRQWTAEELSDAIEVPYATVTREVRRLERAGVLVSVVDGRTKFVSLDTADPVVRALARTITIGGVEPKGGDMSKKKDKKKDKKKKKK